MEKGNIYSELLGVINTLDEEEIEKIPDNVLDSIIENSNSKYMPEYESYREFFDNNEISDESKIFILYFFIRYICDSEEKMELTNYLHINEETNKEKYRYNPEKVFGNNVKEEKTELIVIPKTKWYKRFIEIIVKFVRGKKNG